MRMLSLIAAIALSSACSRAESTDAQSARADALPPAVSAQAPPAATAFKLDERTDLYTLEYDYPAELAAIPTLAAFFGKDIAKIRSELAVAATEDRDFRQKEGFDFNPYSSATAYTVAGKSTALLSVEKAHGEYTGGAHPNHHTAALLWDYPASREISFADLFAAPANRDRLLTQRWCDALNAEREKRRGEPVAASGDSFNQCPPLDEIAIIPADTDSNGRFDRLRLVASPYVAGPYAEGDYEIELGVTDALVAVLKQAYRPSFEPAQPPQ